jgi:hypothetical protein
MQPAPQRGCLPVLLQIYNILALIGLGLAALFVLIAVLAPGIFPLYLGLDSDTGSLVALLLVLIMAQSWSLARVVRTASFRNPPILREHNLFKIASLTLVAWVAVLLGGQVMASAGVLVFLQPFLDLLALGLPMWWLFELGRRKLTAADELTACGSLSLGTTLVPLLAFVSELLAISLFVVFAFSYLQSQPDIIQMLRQIVQSGGVGLDAQKLQQIVSLVLRDPLTIVFLLLFICGVAPLLEELFKPLGILIFARQRPTPAQGFMLGMLCGACFGFLESLMTLSGAGADWYLVVLLRTAAGMLHMVATAIVGWGYAVAVNGMGPRRALLALLAAFGLHAVWNLFAILSSLAPFLSANGIPTAPVLRGLGAAAPFILILLSVGMLAFLVIMNRRFRGVNSRQPASPVM